MTDDDLRFCGAEDAPADVADVHRWYRFSRPGSGTTRLGVSRDAVATRRAAGDDDAAIDAWAIDTGRRILTGHLGDDATEVVIDLPGEPDPDAWRGDRREPRPGS